MTVTISRWGKSSAVRIPKTVLEAARLREGDRVDIVVKDRQIVLMRSKRPTLEELVAKMTLENSHAPTFATPVGNEVW